MCFPPVWPCFFRQHLWRRAFSMQEPFLSSKRWTVLPPIWWMDGSVRPTGLLDGFVSPVCPLVSEEPAVSGNSPSPTEHAAKEATSIAANRNAGSRFFILLFPSFLSLEIAIPHAHDEIVPSYYTHFSLSIPALSAKENRYKERKSCYTVT